MVTSILEPKKEKRYMAIYLTVNKYLNSIVCQITAYITYYQ